MSTRGEAAADLAARGHAADAPAVLDAASAAPGSLVPTADGCSWAAQRLDGPYLTGSGHQAHAEPEPEAG